MERKLNIDYSYVFGCKCFILNNGKENIRKFYSRSDEVNFVGYFITSKAYKVYNKRIPIIE